jgi:YVTN family beta-propeller protein
VIYNQTLSIANTSTTAGAVLHSAIIESKANTQPHGQRPTRSVARSAFRFALAVAASASLVGCGNTYRPVVTAINPVGPAGQPQKFAVAISSTGPSTPGLATFVDFSGDSVLITAPIGVDPYYLVLNSGGTTGYVLNRDTTVNTFDISTQLLSSQVQQTTLLSGANPVSIFPAGTDTYISEPGRSAVADLAGSPPVLKQEFGVANPTYVVGIANAPRVYALGSDTSGNGQASTLETVTDTIDQALIPIGKNPVYGVMTADSKRAFIMNQGDGTVSVINSQTNLLDTIPATGKNFIPVGTSPLWADFAPTRNELVVANAGDGTTPGSVTIISIPLCSVTSLPTNPNCDLNNPVDAIGFGTVLATVPVGINPQMVGVLQDGTRAYVVNQVDSTVSVVNLTSNTVTAVIPVPATVHPNYIAVTTGTPTGKVYVTSPETNNMTIIRTDIDSIDTVVPLQGKGMAVRVTAP